MWNIAHRGASGQAPENTLAAFRRAAEIGVRHIETDLRITKDGRVVAMHDASLLRTTGLPMRVSSKTLRRNSKIERRKMVRSARPEIPARTCANFAGDFAIRRRAARDILFGAEDLAGSRA